MGNVFQMSNERVKDVNRNTFDLSFQNNLTMKFGALYPAFCKEMLPGDTAKIRPTFALEFMPMVFPVQTRMKANLHFFYVRRRTLWKDFMDFMADLTDVEPPYLDFNANFDEYTQTCRLGDYFGLPTTLIGAYGQTLDVATVELRGTSIKDVTGTGMTPTPFKDAASLRDTLSVYNPTGGGFFSYLEDTSDDAYSGENISALYYTINPSSSVTPQELLENGLSFDLQLIQIDELSQAGIFNDLHLTFGICVKISQPSHTRVGVSQGVFVDGSVPAGVTCSYSTQSSGRQFKASFDFSASSSLIKVMSSPSFVQTDPVTIEFAFCIGNGSISKSSEDESYSNPDKIYYLNPESKKMIFRDVCRMYLGRSNEPQPITRETCPFYDSSSDKKDKQKKLSAEPFRAYEAIYNAFYRDIRNNPLILNGKPEYNKYIPTDEGGVDTYPYSIHYRNWEKDFLTTAVQSPQQGVAPLVGITNYVNNLSSDITFVDELGKEYKARIRTTDDGEFIKSVNVDESDLPAENLRALVDYAQSGISINDFRNVNSFQLWLEVNMRQGLRFKDVIKGHYNVDVRYDELQMPEFIGGCSEDVRVNMVTQTSADTEDSFLGSYAGQASCVGTSNNVITHYCDEPGYIIGILSVTPVPNYSQLLPKHFLKRDVLDIFTPEFGHIGFQPITYAEVCPVQAFNDNPASLDDTFGYQRAWYDYLASVDEVHGLFRTELKNYLISRVFDIKPQLSESFLLVDPAVTNTVFASTTESDDKIMGQVYFDCKLKRPIPLYGVPRLE